MDKYKHLSFRKDWEIGVDCAYMLGECEAYVEALTDIPLKPEKRRQLHSISLIKGAQATTAIEGNTLTEEEIGKIQEGWKLPPSKEYLEIEVRNIINAYNDLLREIADEGNDQIITSDLIKRFHKMVGKNLGEHFDAIPGRLRGDSRAVGGYLAPDYRKVPELLDKLCLWLRKEFHYPDNQTFAKAVVQAIVTHVYIEWIHPFGDGNGRTGRLLEFYILLRAGLPSIASHILSNFYNQTRPKYYRRLDNARDTKGLTVFIEYAVQGLRDGLKETLRVIQDDQFRIFWHNYIHETFAKITYTKKEAFKRKRELMLAMPTNKEFDVDDLILLSPKIAKKYAVLNRATILRDLRELIEVELLIKIGRKYKANDQILRFMMPSIAKRHK